MVPEKQSFVRKSRGRRGMDSQSINQHRVRVSDKSCGVAGRRGDRGARVDSQDEEESKESAEVRRR